MTDAIDDLLSRMPSESASESEKEAFMDKVMATPGGVELIRDFASKITAGGSLDVMLKKEEAELERFSLKSPARFIFRIELLETEPQVWRRLSLPADCSYFHLHCAIQDSFGWQDAHHHRFEVWEEGRRELLFCLDGGEKDGSESYCEIENRVVDLFRENVSEFLYFYDLNDCWRHRVVIEGFAAAGEKETSAGPEAHLHDGNGHGPPENCGGVRGFQEFLNGKHPFCENYDPEVLKKFKSGKPDFSKVTFRDPAVLLRRMP